MNRSAQQETVTKFAPLKPLKRYLFGPGQAWFTSESTRQCSSRPSGIWILISLR